MLTNGFFQQVLPPDTTSGDFRTQITYHGGTILNVATIYPIFINCAPTDPYVTTMLNCLQTIVTRPFFEPLSCYGFQTASILPLRPDFVSLPGISTLDDSAIGAIVANYSSFKANLFVVFVGPGITVTHNRKTSATDFNGYHDHNNLAMAYSVVVDKDVQNVSTETETLGHELVETITDPFNSTGWWNSNPNNPYTGDEIGDMCEKEDGAPMDMVGFFAGYYLEYYWVVNYADQPTFGGPIDPYTGPIFPPNHPVAFSLTGESYGPDSDLEITRIVTPTSGRFVGDIASFYDGQHPTVDTARYTVAIDWGDGQASQGVVTYNSTDDSYEVAASHIYTEAPGTTVEVSINVASNDGVGATLVQPETLSDAPLNAEGIQVNSQEGAAVTVATARFDNFAALPVVAIIDWGDNSPDTVGTVSGPDSNGRYTVQGRHTYTEEGRFTVRTSIAVSGSSQGTVNSSAVVSDPAIIGAPGSAIKAFEGVAATLNVATFIDPGGPEIANQDYSASVDWGDHSSSAGTISGPDANGVFTVSGTHTYTDEGKYPVVVTINHEATQPVTVEDHLEASDNVGILLLNRTGSGSLVSSGNGGINVVGAGALIIDSSNAQAGIQSGNNHVIAAHIDVAGKLFHSGNGGFVGKVDKESAAPDPLIGMSVPAVAGPTFKNVSVNNKTVSLLPGRYVGGLRISGKSRVTLLPGVYYLQGGGLTISGASTVGGAGVMIYNAPKSNGDQITLSGTSSLALSAPTNGPYQGIVLFQSRTSAAPVVLSSGGSKAHFNLTGVVYCPMAQVIVGGSGNSSIQGSAANEISGALIAYDLIKSGDGKLTVDASANPILSSLPFLFIPPATAPTAAVEAPSQATSSEASARSSLRQTLSPPPSRVTASTNAATQAISKSKPIAHSLADAIFELLGN